MKFVDSEQFYDAKYYRDENVGEKLESIKNYRRIFRIRKWQPKTILDVGCGQGMFVRALREKGLEAWGLDWSKDAGRLIPDYFFQHDAREPYPFGDKSFDLVVSSALFEHLYENDIDKVYNEMVRVGKKVAAIIGYKSRMVDGIQTHLTIHDEAWWKEKLPGIEILNSKS